MPDNKRSYKRRQYFIKKEFQVKFVLKFCLLIVFGTIISTGLLFLFSQDTLTSSFQQSRLVIKSTGLAILPSVLYTNLITLGLIAIATIIVTLLVSHKMAGPLFRFEKELRNIGKGDLTTKVVLRKDDTMESMAGCLNNMTSGLHDKVLDIQTEVKHILESASGQNGPQGLIEELHRLQEKIGNNFKI